MSSAAPKVVQFQQPIVTPGLENVPENLVRSWSSETYRKVQFCVTTFPIIIKRLQTQAKPTETSAPPYDLERVQSKLTFCENLQHHVEDCLQALKGLVRADPEESQRVVCVNMLTSTQGLAHLLCATSAVRLGAMGGHPGFQRHGSIRMGPCRSARTQNPPPDDQ